jgi:shikimate kinase
MSALPLIILVGYRGTGKTTVARLLASRLGWNAIDADELLEERAGQTIAALFQTEGEASFRRREAALVQELCQRRRQVIATGGGVILDPGNRECLKKAGKVIWLTADAPTLHRRLQSDVHTAARRPALTVGGLEEIQQLLAEREPLYRECAHWKVATHQGSPDEVAQNILEWLKNNSYVERVG